MLCRLVSDYLVHAPPPSVCKPRQHERTGTASPNNIPLEQTPLLRCHFPRPLPPQRTQPPAHTPQRTPAIFINARVARLLEAPQTLEGAFKTPRPDQSSALGCCLSDSNVSRAYAARKGSRVEGASCGRIAVYIQPLLADSCAACRRVLITSFLSAPATAPGGVGRKRTMHAVDCLDTCSAPICCTCRLQYATSTSIYLSVGRQDAHTHALPRELTKSVGCTLCCCAEQRLDSVSLLHASVSVLGPLHQERGVITCSLPPIHI